MLFYILSFVMHFFFLAYVLKSEYIQQKSILMLCILPLFLLVAVRGDVGTDTLSYLDIISKIQEYGSFKVELGFVYLVKAMLYLGASPRLILVLVALITTLILCFSSTFSKRALMVSSLCIVPIFYLDMTMNGLRYGLSFSAAGLSVAYLYRKKFLATALWGVCAVMFHISSLLIFFIMLLLADDKKEFIQWLKLVSGLFVVGLYPALSTWIASYASTAAMPMREKAIAYSNSPSPSLFSGLAPLMISLIVLLVIKVGDSRGEMLVAEKKLRIISRRFYILLSLIIATFIIAKFTYAGLRLQFLVLFSMLVGLQFKPKFAGELTIKGNKDMLYMLILIGALGVVSFFKNAYLSAGQGNSPWLPYTINPYFTSFGS